MKKFIFIFFIITASLIASGKQKKIEGIVYEWTDAPPWAQSQVFINDSIPPGRNLNALDSASIKLIYAEFFSQFDTTGIKFEISALSKKDGEFSIKPAPDTNRLMTSLVIQKKGFITAVKRIPDINAVAGNLIIVHLIPIKIKK